MPASEQQFVCLRDGLTLPLTPVLLLLDLEARGLRVRRDGDDIVVSPRRALTRDDCAALTRWKPHVLAIIDSCETTQ